jgi:hypothetical protein
MIFFKKRTDKDRLKEWVDATIEQRNLLLKRQTERYLEGFNSLADQMQEKIDDLDSKILHYFVKLRREDITFVDIVEEMREEIGIK